MTDGSPFSVKERWMIVWDTELPSEHFSPFVQKCIKSILSTIVVARCLTTYVYVVSAMLVIFCILKDSAPKLILIWLLVAGLKSICMTFVEALTGVYVCSAFGKIRKACVEFFISKALEIIFAAYLWGSVLNIYHDMTREADNKEPENWDQFFKQFRRPRARSLLDESTLHKTACLNNFEFKDVPQIILQMLRREEEMSQDSLLGSGMMLASVSNFESFDDLKTSQSLGELGLLELKSVQVVGIDENEILSPSEKALRFLKLNWGDVKKAQGHKKADRKDLYTIDDETWTRVTASRAHINKPKQARPEVILHEIPQLDDENRSMKKENRKRSLELKFGFSLFSFIREKNELRTRDEEQLSYNWEEDDEEAEEEGLAPLFMSNIREEVAVNRIKLDFVSKKFKGNAYAKLYKEDYMSVIGPEVFDRATKLPKVGPPGIYKIKERTSASLPVLHEGNGKIKKKINFEEAFEKEEITSKSSETDNLDEFREEISEHSEENLYLFSRLSDNKTAEEGTNLNLHSLYSFQDNERDSGIFRVWEEEDNLKKKTSEVQPDDAAIAKKNDNDICRTDKVKEFNLGKLEKETIIPSQVYFERFKDNECQSDAINQDEIKNVCYKKKRIIIKRMGKPVKISKISNSNSAEQEKFKVFDESTPKESVIKCNGKGNHINVRSAYVRDLLRSSGEEKKTNGNLKKKQMYFYSKIIVRPFVDILGTSQDQKNIQCREKPNDFSKRKTTERKNYFQNFKPEKSNDCSFKKEKENKMWKSQVLEVAAKCSRISSHSPETHRIVKNEYASNTLNKIFAKKLLQNHDHSQIPNLCLNSSETSMVRDAHDFQNSFSTLNNRNLFDDDINELPSELNCQKKSASSNSESHNYPTDSFNSEVKEFKQTLIGSPKIKTRMNFTHSEESNFQSLAPNKLADKELSVTSKSRMKNENSDLLHSGNPMSMNCNSPGDDLANGRSSEESFSLYYSKAADLASPLLDMKRFIYPDHIHYSYKHVKKKGFDIDINGGLPLLVRESLTMNAPVNVKSVSKSQNPELSITRRPMDLSFASSNAFAEWQNSDQIDVSPSAREFKAAKNETSQRNQNKRDKKLLEGNKEKKNKKLKRNKKDNEPSHSLLKCDFLKRPKSKSSSRNLDGNIHKYSEKDYFLVEKLLKMNKRLNNKKMTRSEEEGKECPPVQISSTQLHSNKGRISSTYNPAIVLNQNKTRNEKKKIETQEERTKDMFARLEREVLLQSKNLHKNFG